MDYKSITLFTKIFTKWQLRKTWSIESFSPRLTTVEIFIVCLMPHGWSSFLVTTILWIIIWTGILSILFPYRCSSVRWKIFSRLSDLVLLYCFISLGQSGWQCEFSSLISTKSLIFSVVFVHFDRFLAALYFLLYLFGTSLVKIEFILIHWSLGPLSGLIWSAN